MCHALAVLQPALASLGAGGGPPHPDASRGFDHARAYYALLPSPADSLVKGAAERPLRFTPAEYLALLQVRPLHNTPLRCDHIKLDFNSKCVKKVDL